MGVIHLADRSNNAAHISPMETLHRVITVQEAGGEWEGRKKMIVISLYDEEGQFDVSFRNAGMSCSDILAAIRIMEYKMLMAMGYAE